MQCTVISVVQQQAFCCCSLPLLTVGPTISCPCTLLCSLLARLAVHPWFSPPRLTLQHTCGVAVAPERFHSGLLVSDWITFAPAAAGLGSWRKRLSCCTCTALLICRSLGLGCSTCNVLPAVSNGCYDISCSVPLIFGHHLYGCQAVYDFFADWMGRVPAVHLKCCRLALAPGAALSAAGSSNNRQNPTNPIMFCISIVVQKPAGRRPTCQFHRPACAGRCQAAMRECWQ